MMSEHRNGATVGESAMTAPVNRPLLFEGRPLSWRRANDRNWFIGRDACEMLGIVKHRNALQRLDEDETTLLAIDTPGGVQETVAVSESGLYHLAFISRKPIAKRFRRWVTEEVLPSIRRTGGYRVGAEQESDAGRNSLTEEQWRLFVQLRQEGRYLVTRMPDGRLTVERSEWENLLDRWDATTAMSLVHMVRLIETQGSRRQQVHTVSPALLDLNPPTRIDMTSFIRQAVEIGDDQSLAIRRDDAGQKPGEWRSSR